MTVTTSTEETMLGESEPGPACAPFQLNVYILQIKIVGRDADCVQFARDIAAGSELLLRRGTDSTPGIASMDLNLAKMVTL